jgi:hypothetical protein
VPAAGTQVRADHLLSHRHFPFCNLRELDLHGIFFSPLDDAFVRKEFNMFFAL